MSEQLDPQTFDLIGMLSGRDYPELEIEVYFNEALGLSIYTMEKLLTRLETLDKKTEAKKVAKELDGLVKSVPQHKFIITLKGVPEKALRAVRAKHLEEFPVEVNSFGLPVPDTKGEEDFMLKMWRLFTREITDPTGAKVLVTDAEIQAIYDNAPKRVHEQLSEGIENLRNNSVKGFEFAAQEPSFL